MRFIIATLIALMLFGVSSAYAQSAYDDVPRDHWAYNALDYLTERGVLEGYPDGFFKGDRTLTRYEFAQAVARLLDTLDQKDWGEQINIMAETLRAEFSDQLAEINSKVDGMGNQINDLEGKVGDLEGVVADTNSKVGALEEKINGLKPGPNWKGSFRYRWQFDQYSDPNEFTGYVPREDRERFRQRIMFMLGYNKQINDAVEVAFRLKTNTGNDATSGNFTLGNDGRTADIFLDRAYVKYTPSWFGYYTNEDCKECTPKLDIYAGIYPNITYDPHEMILDDDVNFQGVGVVYHFNKDFQILTTASVVVENFGGADSSYDDDTYLFATELKYNNLIWCGLDAWVGCYGWQNESSLPGSYFTGNSLEGFDFNNDGVVNGDDRFSSNFDTIKGGLQYTFQCTFNKPLALYGEYMINTQSNAEDRINLVNPFIDPNIIYETTDDTGFDFGMQYGEKPDACGEWYAYAQYKEIGANAVVSGLADADAGGANTNSLEVGWAWMWADNSLMGITYFLNKMNNAFNFLVPEDKDDHSIIQVDWTFKF